MNSSLTHLKTLNDSSRSYRRIKVKVRAENASIVSGTDYHSVDKYTFEKIKNCPADAMQEFIKLIKYSTQGQEGYGF